jgi:membrane protein DedA with SNARE-associated domain
LSKILRPLLIVVLVMATLATLLFGVRTYRAWQLFASAQAVDAADTAGIRPWMTIAYIAATYHVPEASLAARLGSSPESSGRTTLRELASQRGQQPLEVARSAQQAIADLRRTGPAPAPTAPTTTAVTWLGGLTDQLLEAVLVFGYPALALLLFGGAVGLPLPSGLATSVVGSLAARGQLALLPAGLVAVLSSVLGDLVGYQIGRAVGRDFLGRHGRWIGLPAPRLAQAERFFDRWGAVGLLASRTIVSGLSLAVNLLAGASGYRLRSFAGWDSVGRLGWTVIYLGLGYGFERSAGLAAELADNLCGLLVSLAVIVVAASMLYRYREGTAVASA